MVIQALRDNIPKWVTGVILAMLIVPFALWGINSYFTAVTDTSAATVNGDSISPGDFQRAYQNQYTRLQQLYGANFRPELINEKQLRQQVLDNLVNQTLLNQYIADAHYSVGDQQLVADIQKMPAFQVDGKFSTQVYTVALGQSGLSPTEFERRYRESLQIEQFQNAVENSAFVTKAQLEGAVAVRDQQREVAYLKLSAAKFLNQAAVSDQDVATYYKAHGADFMTPEKVSLAYVELDEAQLAKGVTADDAALQAEYQQHLANYTQSEARRAQHILIAIKGSDSKLDAAAKAKAEDLLKQIQAGADFSTLAAKNSDDPGSAKSGGDLGMVEHGVMVKPFEEALFAIKKPGDVVGPIRTQFGYHLIKLVEVRASQVKPFADVKQQIAADFQKKKADDEYFGIGEKLANLAYEHPSSLDEVSKELRLQVQMVDDVTRDIGTGVAANADVRKAAFGDQVLGQGNNSEPIQIGPNHAVVIRVKGHVPAEPKPLDQVRAQIVTLLKQQYAAQQTQKLADSLVKALRQGQDPAQLAKSDGAVFTPARFVGPQDTSLPQAVSMAAFAAPQPVAGGRTVSAVALGSGDQAVYLLTAVKPGTTTGMNEQQTTAESRALGRAVGGNDFAAYLAYLHRGAKIKINTANVEPQDQ